MAIEYDLAMGTLLPATHIAGEVHEIARTLGLFDVAISPQSILDDGARTRLDLWIRVIDANPRVHDPVTEDLGFVPKVRVAFRLGKSTDMSAQEDEMVRLVSSLLDRLPGDAVLHFQYEEIWLLRRKGELSVSEQDDIWPQQRLAAVHQPYRRATYAFD